MMAQALQEKLSAALWEGSRRIAEIIMEDCCVGYLRRQSGRLPGFQELEAAEKAEILAAAQREFITGESGSAVDKCAPAVYNYICKS